MAGTPRSIRSTSATGSDIDQVVRAINTIATALETFRTEWNTKQGGGTITLSEIIAYRILGVTIPTTSPGAATITKTSGDTQSATVATQVANPLVVTVRDINGQVVPNAVVSWTITGDGVVGANSTTDSTGQASINVTIGTVANDYTVTASNSVGASVTFTATGTAGAAFTIAPRTVVDQSAQTSTTVGVPPSVLITDVYGNPKSGTVVTYAVTGGGGSGTSLTPTSDASGIATVGSWTVGAANGANTMTATAAGLAGSPVTFRCSGTTPNVPTIITINSGGTQSSITAGSASANLECKVTNDALTAQQGVRVFYTVATGSGTLSAAFADTNASGLCSVTYTTHTTVATATVQARAYNASGVELTNSPLTFTLTSVAGAATKLVINTQPQPSGAVDGVVWSQQPVIYITDANGNRKTSDTSTVTVAKQSGSGTLQGTLTAVAAAGIATFTNLKIAGSGDHTLVFTDGALTQVISGTISIAPPVPVAVQFQGPVTGNTEGIAWASFGVQVVDASNVVVPGSTATVTLSLSAGGTIGGTVSQQATAGVVTYSDITGTPAGTYTLTAASSGLTSATTSVTITSAVPQTHPNEPASMTVLVNENPIIATATPNTGWTIQSGGSRLSAILPSAVASGHGAQTFPATLTGGLINQGQCPTGVTGGAAPFYVDKTFAQTYNEIYSDEWLQWDPNYDIGQWGNTTFGVSKHGLWFEIASGNQCLMVVQGNDFGACQLRFALQNCMRGPDNQITTDMDTSGGCFVTIQGGLQRSKWYRVIRYHKLNTGASTFDGIAKVWIGDENTDFSAASALKVNLTRVGYAGNNTNAGKPFGSKFNHVKWNPTSPSASGSPPNPVAFAHYMANPYVSGK